MFFFLPIQGFWQVLKKKEIFDRKFFKLQHFSKGFPMLVETPYFEGFFNPKTYLNHELGSNFFPDYFGIKISKPIGFLTKFHVN